MNMEIMNIKKYLIALLTVTTTAATPAFAQTSIGTYRPGITEEGAIYYLPKTAVRIVVRSEKSTYKPGDLSKYAERYLRLKNVSQVPAVSHRIISIRQEAIAVADTAKRYAVKFDYRTVAANVALSNDGVLLAINATPLQPKTEEQFRPAPRQETVNPRNFMSEDILAAGSLAKQAELTAQEIYDIRESRNLLVRGQADNMPKDGAQMQLMLDQLNMQDQSLTSLFAGTTVRDTVEQAFTIVPDKDIERSVIFRFSQKLGLLDSDDLAGVPYYISVSDLHAAPAQDPEAKKKKDKQEPGIYVNVPGKMKVSVANDTETLLSAELPAPQFGNTELLSGALFNKRYTTHLWLNPLTGAVDRLEAEQPK